MQTRKFNQVELNQALEGYPRPIQKSESFIWRYIIGVLVGVVLGLYVGMVLERAITQAVQDQLEERSQW